VCLAFLAGAALALTGAVFQALLRNPLATPYTLGVASGGSLGAVLSLFLPTLAHRLGSERAGTVLAAVAAGVGPFTGTQVCSVAFSFLMVALIYALARGRSRISTMGLLLAGVTLGLICSAAILLIRYLSEPTLVVIMDRWLMGGLDVTGWGGVWPVLPILIPGAAILLVEARKYDLMTFGDELAAGRGINVARLQKVSFFGGSLLTASVVAMAGPIGFVGLIVPHTVRRLVGPDHRLVLPCVFFAGGAFLVVCDTVARTAFSPQELPVGIITALLGGPFFLYLLVRGRGAL
jgi:iron complex transport system permease protein